MYVPSGAAEAVLGGPGTCRPRRSTRAGRPDPRAIVGVDVLVPEAEVARDLAGLVTERPALPRPDESLGDEVEVVGDVARRAVGHSGSVLAPPHGRVGGDERAVRPWSRRLSRAFSRIVSSWAQQDEQHEQRAPDVDAVVEVGPPGRVVGDVGDQQARRQKQRASVGRHPAVTASRAVLRRRHRRRRRERRQRRQAQPPRRRTRAAGSRPAGSCRRTSVPPRCRERS